MYLISNSIHFRVQIQVNSFLKQYNRAAFMNGWSDSDKTSYIPIFFEGSAFDNLQCDINDMIGWALKKIDVGIQKYRQIFNEFTNNHIGGNNYRQSSTSFYAVICLQLDKKIYCLHNNYRLNSV